MLVPVVVVLPISLRAAVTVRAILALLGPVPAVFLVRLLLVGLLRVRVAVLAVLWPVARLTLSGVAVVWPVAKTAVDGRVVLVVLVASVTL